MGRKVFVKSWSYFFKNTGTNISPKCWIEISFVPDGTFAHIKHFTQR